MAYCPVHNDGLAHIKGEGMPMHPDDFEVGDQVWMPGEEGWERQLKAYEDCFCTCEKTAKE